MNTAKQSMPSESAIWRRRVLALAALAVGIVLAANPNGRTSATTGACAAAVPAAQVVCR